MKNYLKNEFDPSKLPEMYDEIALWSAPFGLKMLDHIDYRRNIKALDIGFGTGFPLIELAMRLGHGSVVYGLDPWAEAIERAKKKIDFLGITNIKIMQGVAETIPLPDDSVDLITSNNGINNVTDINQTLSECSRVIKNGGQFVMTMNTDKTMFEFYVQLEKTLSENGMKDAIELMHRHISEKRPPLDKIIFLLQSNGFKIKDIEQDQFNYRFTDGTAMFNHSFIRLAFFDKWVKLLPADKAESILKAVENRLNREAADFGSIKLSVPFVLINLVSEKK